MRVTNLQLYVMYDLSKAKLEPAFLQATRLIRYIVLLDIHSSVHLSVFDDSSSLNQQMIFKVFCVCLRRVQLLDDDNTEMKLNVCRLKSQTEKLDQVSGTNSKNNSSLIQHGLICVLAVISVNKNKHVVKAVNVNG